MRDHPDASAYHLSAWARVLRRAYGYSPRYLALERDGRVEGVLPVMASRGLVTGRRMRTLPALGSVGPLATSAEDLRALLEAGCRLTDHWGAKSWTIHARQGGHERLVPELRLTSSFKTWIAPLPDDADALRASWKKTQNNLWRGLKKADKAGVTVRESRSDADLRAFYRLYEENVRRHRSLPRSYRMFTAKRDEIPADVFKLLVAVHEGEVVAGATLNTFGTNIDLAYNASSSRHLDLRPNHAVYWHAIRWGIENGYRTYTMGQAPEGGSLARFKAQWGGEPVDRFRYDYRPGQPGASTAADSLRKASVQLDVGERDESLVSRAWSQAPLPLLRAAGEVAYRIF